MIVQHLAQARNLPKLETLHLYRCAALHFNVPRLLPTEEESEGQFLERTKRTLQQVMLLPRALRKQKEKRRLNRGLYKFGANPFLEWRTRQDRLATARGLAHEIQSSYDTAHELLTLRIPLQSGNDLFNTAQPNLGMR